jgi:tripartite-type tricarboxylate transporter receptor subunit TctC
MKHIGALALALGMWASNAAHAQDAWPSRAITFIVPYGPGGYTDLVGRLTARYVEKALGKPVIVESRVGAGGIVGTQYVASAAPDGYTSVSAASAPSRSRRLPKSSDTIQCRTWRRWVSSARSCRRSSSRRICR